MALYKMYEGAEVCQGCGKSGKEKPRHNKNELCEKCKNVFNEGMFSEVNAGIEYVTIQDWVNGFNKIDQNDRILDAMANSVFQALHNPHAKSSAHISSQRAQPHGQKYYKIPVKVAEPLNEFLRGCNDAIKAISQKRKDTEQYARDAVAAEKNKIYNEGVEKGRELLFSLNNGSITMDDFSKRIDKF